MYGDSDAAGGQPDFYIDWVRKQAKRRAMLAADEARRLHEEERREIENKRRAEVEPSH